MAFRAIRDWFRATEHYSDERSSGLLLPSESVVIGVDREREKIGEGAFAKVYVGVHHGKQVAVKVFKENAITIDSEQPKKEFEMLISLKHPNIVRLYGMWRDPHKGRNVLAIVMELCNCSLGKYIREHFGQRGISREKKLQILRGITNAMIYLHGQNVLHRHLNSSNVLVNQIQNRKDCDSITAKLTDVDIAQVLDPQSQVLYADLIYEASLPPEVLHGHEHKGKMKNLARLTAQVDVFCFGPIAIELACGEFPIPTAKVETRKGEVVQTYSEIERRNKYLMKIKPADRMFTDLIVEQCMADQPEERGSFLDLQVIIECFQRKYEKRSDKELLEEKQFEMEELRAQMEVDQREWEHERGGLRIQLVSIKESKSSLKNHLAEVQEEMEATKVQQRELENERGELRTQLTSAKENESSLKTQLTEMQEELVVTKREWEHERGGLRIQLVSIKESESSLKNHLAEVQEEMEATKRECTQKANDRDCIIVENIGLKKDIDMFKEKMVEQNSNFTDLKRAHVKLEQAKQSLDKECSVLRKETVQKRQELTLLQVKLKEADKEAAASEKEKKLKDGKIQKMEIEYERLRNVNLQLITAKQEHKKVEDDLQRQIQTLVKSKSELQVELGNLKKHKERENAASIAQQRKLENEIVRLRSQCSKDQKEEESLNKQPKETEHLMKKTTGDLQASKECTRLQELVDSLKTDQKKTTAAKEELDRKLRASQKAETSLKAQLGECHQLTARLEVDLKMAASKRDELTAQLKSTALKLDKEEEHKREISTELQELQNQYQVLHRTLTSTRAAKDKQLAEAEKQWQQKEANLKDALSKTQEEISTLNHQLEEITAKLQQCQEQLDRVMAEKKRLEESYLEALSQHPHGQLLIKLQEELVKVRQDMDDIKGKVVDTHDVVVSVQDSVVVVKDEVVTVKDEVVMVKDEVVMVKDEVVTVKDEVVLVKGDVANVNDGVVKANEGVVKVNEGVVKVNEDVVKLKDVVIEGNAGVRDTSPDIVSLQETPESTLHVRETELSAVESAENLQVVANCTQDVSSVHLEGRVQLPLEGVLGRSSVTHQQGLGEQISSVEDSDNGEANDVLPLTGRQPLASICEEPPNRTEDTPQAEPVTSPPPVWTERSTSNESPVVSLRMMSLPSSPLIDKEIPAEEHVRRMNLPLPVHSERSITDNISSNSVNDQPHKTQDKGKTSDPLLKLEIPHLMPFLRDLAPEGLSIAGYLGRTDEWENLEVSYPRPVDRLHMLLKGWLASKEKPSNPHTWEYFIEIVEKVGKGQVAERIGRAVFEGDTSV